MTSKENGNWKLTLFISKVVLKLIWFDFRNPKRVHSKWFENEVRMFHLFSKILKIPCLKQISKEPELICLLFIWDLIIKSSFQMSLKNKAYYVYLSFQWLENGWVYFKNLKNIYSKEFQNMVEIFSWVLNIKHILKAISKGVEKENLFGFDWKSFLLKSKTFQNA